jgi:hypothetical protein
MDYHNMTSPSMMSGSQSVMEVSSWLYFKPSQQTSPQEQATPKSGESADSSTSLLFTFSDKAYLTISFATLITISTVQLYFYLLMPPTFIFLQNECVLKINE